MEHEKQRCICEFFGEDVQIEHKADEELDEICEAYERYKKNRTTENLILLIDEVNDLLNVLEGICANNGVNLDEVKLRKEKKLDRCIGIINRIKTGTEDKMGEYDRIRYQEDIR